MDIIQKIESIESVFSESEKKVYRKIIENPAIVTMYTISQVAMIAETSTAAVLRFCQRIGFSGYKDFRYEIMSWQKDHSAEKNKDTVTRIASAYSQAIRDLDLLDREQLDRLCEDILSSEKVIVLGRHRTSTASAKLQMNLTDLGITAITGRDTLAFQHLLYIINTETAVIMFSTTGEITDQEEFLKQLAGQTEKIWLITPARSAKMSAYANHTLEIPAVTVANTFAGSQTVMMAFADILTALLDEKSGKRN